MTGVVDTEEPKKKPAFLAELRRRKVFRVAITYAVVAWLIIQVAAVTFGDFGIPVWAFRFVVLMVILGFPLALVIAWAFELTPDGVVKSSSARKEDSGSGHDIAALNRKRNWLAIAFAGGLPTLIFGSLALVFYLTRSPNDSSLDKGAITDSINPDRPYVIGNVAMLPLTIFGETEGIQVIAEGLHDETLTALSEMGPLNVVSRTSVLKMSNSQLGIPEMGQALGADFILEGSIQAVGPKIRVTLQLIEAANDHHIWANTFDHDLDPDEAPLTFQKEYAYELAIRTYQALEQAFPPQGETKRFRDQHLADFQAKIPELADRFWGNQGRPRELELYMPILTECREILIMKPDFIPAHNRIAEVIAQAHWQPGLRSIYDEEWRISLYLSLKRAHVVNPNGYTVNYNLGQTYIVVFNKPYEAISYLRQALEAQDVGMAGNHWASTELARALVVTGQDRAALAIINKSQPMEPAEALVQGLSASQAYCSIHEYEKAMAAAEGLIGDYLSSLILTRWSGSKDPLRGIQDRIQANQYSEENLPRGDMQIIVALYLEDYDLLATLLSSVEVGDRFDQLSPIDQAFFRGWVNLVTGNEALARSYFKALLNQLQDSPRGKWMQEFQPDVHASNKALIHAFLGDSTEALAWAETAIEAADPSKNFMDYVDSLLALSEAYTQLGMPGKACRVIDQILSSPSGWYSSPGYFITWPLYKDLHDKPEFEVVIRKHAENLKDPAILEEFFKKAA